MVAVSELNKSWNVCIWAQVWKVLPRVAAVEVGARRYRLCGCQAANFLQGLKSDGCRYFYIAQHMLCTMFAALPCCFLALKYEELMGCTLVRINCMVTGLNCLTCIKPICCQGFPLRTMARQKEKAISTLLTALQIHGLAKLWGGLACWHFYGTCSFTHWLKNHRAPIRKVLQIYLNIPYGVSFSPCLLK